MCSGNLLQPDLVLGETVLGITPEMLQKYNLQGLILDVDETLVPTTEAYTSEELHNWIETLKPLASIWLVSNNINERRISRIADALEVPYLLGAGKPSRRKLRQAAAAMNLPIHTIAMVGDRLFTDVLAGNRLGMFTILVNPMINANQALRNYHIHAVEVWISQRLGVSLQKRTEP